MQLVKDSLYLLEIRRCRSLKTLLFLAHSQLVLQCQNGVHSMIGHLCFTPLTPLPLRSVIIIFDLFKHFIK